MKTKMMMFATLFINSTAAIADHNVVDTRVKLLETKYVKIGQCENSYYGSMIGVRILSKVINKKLVYLVSRSTVDGGETYMANSSKIIEVASIREEKWFMNIQGDNFRNCEDYRQKLIFQTE